ncbi:MAG: glycosyl transferase family 1, partial [Chloroflexi bacterium]|nr:glycosyl transferase family 1 [Chloroflexota bacterium]
MSRVRRLQDYAEFVGPEELREIWSLVRHVEGATMVHVNSTRMGGGVAEILEAMIPLLNSLGVSARWEVIEPLP